MAQVFLNEHIINPNVSNYSETKHSLRADTQKLLEAAPIKYGVRIGAAVVGIALAAEAFGGLSGGNSDPNKYEINQNVSSVTLEEGANIRHDPLVGSAEDSLPIHTLDHATTIDTPSGAYHAEEYRNGSWVGIKLTDIDPAAIPNFDTKGDKDGIGWINNQKVSATTDD